MVNTNQKLFNSVTPCSTRTVGLLFIGLIGMLLLLHYGFYNQKDYFITIVVSGMISIGKAINVKEL